jgi:hypothetical protein
MNASVCVTSSSHWTSIGEHRPASSRPSIHLVLNTPSHGQQLPLLACVCNAWWKGPWRGDPVPWMVVVVRVAAEPSFSGGAAAGTVFIFVSRLFRQRIQSGSCFSLVLMLLQWWSMHHPFSQPPTDEDDKTSTMGCCTDERMPPTHVWNLSLFAVRHRVPTSDGPND